MTSHKGMSSHEAPRLVLKDQGRNDMPFFQYFASHHSMHAHLHRVTRQTPRATLSRIPAYTHGTGRAREARGTSDANGPWLAAIAALPLRSRLAITPRSSRRTSSTGRPRGSGLAGPSCHTLQPR